MHELHVPDAALVRFFQPFELPVEEIKPLYVSHDRRLSHFVRRLQIGRGKGAPQAVMSNHLIHPGKTLQMVKFTRLRRAQGGEHTLGIARQYGAVRHVEVRHATASDPDCIALAKVVAWRRLGGDPRFAAMTVDIDGDALPEQVERTRGGLGRPAASVEPRGPTSPASIASTELSDGLEIQGGCATARP